MDKFYEGPPRCLVYPKLWITLGDSATGNEVDDHGEGIRGNDNDSNNNGNHDGDSDGNGDGTMGSVTTGYDNDGDDDGDMRDDNDAMTTLAAAHQAGYYAPGRILCTFNSNWKNMWQRRNGR